VLLAFLILLLLVVGFETVGFRLSEALLIFVGSTLLFFSFDPRYYCTLMVPWGSHFRTALHSGISTVFGRGFKQRACYRRRCRRFSDSVPYFAKDDIRPTKPYQSKSHRNRVYCRPYEHNFNVRARRRRPYLEYLRNRNCRKCHRYRACKEAMGKRRPYRLRFCSLGVLLGADLARLGDILSYQPRGFAFASVGVQRFRCYLLSRSFGGDH